MSGIPEGVTEVYRNPKGVTGTEKSIAKEETVLVAEDVDSELFAVKDIVRKKM